MASEREGRVVTQHVTRRAGFWATAALLSVLTVLVFLWLLLRIGGGAVTDGVDDVAELVAALVAGGACFFAAARVRAARTAWRLLAASCLSWGAGEAVWSYYDLVRKVQVPFPSVADLGFLVAVPLAAAGLLRFPGGPLVTSSRFRSLLDSLIIGGSVFFVSWSTVLGPVFGQHQSGFLQEIVSLAYPVGDVVLASLVVMLATRPGRRNRVSLGLVMAGVLAFAVADSSFAYLTEVHNYGIGNALDTGWVLGYFLVALGALWATTQRVESAALESRATGWTVLGPYVPLSVAGVVFVWRVFAGPPLRSVSELVGFGLVCVVSLRQIVALVDNMALTTKLESKIEERTAELQHQALHDTLTGLANRALFNEYLSTAVRRRSRSGAALAVLFVDLDGFKRVNDLHGHVVGDKVLQEVAHRFERTLREADTIARLGGDEFAVLLEHELSASDPGRVAQRLLESLDRPIRMGSVRLVVRASIGVSFDTSGAESADELLRNADLAMYTAKGRGSHSYEVYSPDMHSTILERMRTEAELHGALGNGELLLYYQPVVGAATGAIEGVEALLRWQHPRRGLLAPDEFIPAAESSGLIVPIGAWVLSSACQQLQQWRTHASVADLTLAVNLSRRQLCDDALIDTVSSALSASGLDPRLLTLEVTESVVMDDVPYAVSVMEQLRRLGVRIAIDDFGTGYSSLSALRDLPVDCLKIDKSFVAAIASNKGAADVTQRILQLASDFCLHTVAEGVEERAQLVVLQDLGCDSVQGFYYARPLPPDQMEASLVHGPALAPAQHESVG